MNLNSFGNKEILEELKEGNRDVLKGLPSVLKIQFGLTLQNEADNFQEESPINREELNKAMLALLSDGEVKEQLTKQIEEEKVTEKQ